MLGSRHSAEDMSVGERELVLAALWVAPAVADARLGKLLNFYCRAKALRRLLPMKNGERPIRVAFDFMADNKWWRRVMKGATVRHLSLRRGGVDDREQEKVGLEVVAGGVLQTVNMSTRPNGRIPSQTCQSANGSSRWPTSRSRRR